MPEIARGTALGARHAPPAAAAVRAPRGSRAAADAEQPERARRAGLRTRRLAGPTFALDVAVQPTRRVCASAPVESGLFRRMAAAFVPPNSGQNGQQRTAGAQIIELHRRQFGRLLEWA